MADGARGAALVLDDDAFSRRLASKCLNELGWPDVTECSSAGDALRQLGLGDYRLILCDLDMPESDGIDFLRAVGNFDTSVHILIMSGVGEDLLETAERMASSIGLRILGALPKPIDRQQLERALNTAKPRPAAAPRAASQASLSARETQELIASHVVPWYQPKIDFESRAIIGAEVLSRAPDVEGFDTPLFVRSAERHGLAGDLTHAILPRLARDIANLPASAAALRFSINLSAGELSNLELPDQLSRELEGLGLANERLTIELTETSDLPDLVASMDVLTRLRLKGFGLALDDFGTGFAAFDKLVGLPFTEVKLDRTLLADARVRHRGRVVFESATTMARKLALMCTAEGIESEEDQRIAVEAGCTVGQGFFYSPAVAMEEFAAWADHWPPEGR